LQLPQAVSRPNYTSISTGILENSFSRIFLKLLAAVLTIYVCILSSERYFMYWVQTTIERTDVHISEIAFPAITICPTHLNLANFNGTNKKHIELNRLNRLYNLVNAIQWNTRPEDLLNCTNKVSERMYPNLNQADVLGLSPGYQQVSQSALNHI